MMDVTLIVRWNEDVEGGGGGSGGSVSGGGGDGGGGDGGGGDGVIVSLSGVFTS